MISKLDMNSRYEASLDKLCEQDGVKGVLVLDSVGLCVSRRGVAKIADVEQILRTESVARASDPQKGEILAFRLSEYLILFQRFPKMLLILYKHPDEPS